MSIDRRRLLSRWWMLPVGATAGAFGYMGLRAAHILGGKTAPGEATWHDSAPEQIAEAAELSQPWQSVEFLYAGQPCIAVAIEAEQAPPQATKHENIAVVAFSRLCTHQRCPVVLVRDSEVLSLAYNYRPPDGKPQLGCPCHYSVFSVLEDGKAVFGQAVKALPRVKIELKEGKWWAVAAEWPSS